MSKVTRSFISRATFQETSWKLALVRDFPQNPQLKVKTLCWFCQCVKKTNRVVIFEQK